MLATHHLKYSVWLMFFKWDIFAHRFFCFVLDIPSAPQAVWTNNLEFRTRIHWTAPSHSGGLPLIYAVKGQCKNTSYPGLPECESEFFNLCESSPILSIPESDSFFCKVSYPLHQDVVTYNAFVEATNALGSSRSNPVEFKANLNHVVLSKYNSIGILIHSSHCFQACYWGLPVVIVLFWNFI